MRQKLVGRVIGVWGPVTALAADENGPETLVAGSGRASPMRVRCLSLGRYTYVLIRDFKESVFGQTVGPASPTHAAR
jgi:hypothetical protein